MPSLDELSDLTAREEFVKSVAEMATKRVDQPVAVNAGIKTSAELYSHVMQGRDVQFDYQRLIEDSHAY
ncbi:MAG: hypothetical protein J0649_09130 [Methylococcales bacterium]|jgi:hypothetical protein|nr:hypothetical protein [Methylococcales bacterium]